MSHGPHRTVPCGRKHASARTACAPVRGKAGASRREGEGSRVGAKAGVDPKSEPGDSHRRGCGTRRQLDFDLADAAPSLSARASIYAFGPILQLSDGSAVCPRDGSREDSRTALPSGCSHPARGHLRRRVVDRPAVESGRMPATWRLLDRLKRRCCTPRRVPQRTCSEGRGSSHAVPTGRCRDGAAGCPLP